MAGGEVTARGEDVAGERVAQGRRDGHGAPDGRRSEEGRRGRGKGKRVITGLREKGMEESAQAAMSYIRSRSTILKLEPDFYQKVDVHVHFPDFVRKDGPSAGVTMATSIASALTRVPVRNEVAMTGEITLRGRVMPIGGLKEKILAAHRNGITTVLVPKENRKDLREIPRRVLKTLRVVLVEHMDDVLREATVFPEPDTLFGPPRSSLSSPTGARTDDEAQDASGPSPVPCPGRPRATPPGVPASPQGETPRLATPRLRL